MPRPVEGTSAYNPGLDGLRAIAVLGVIAYHLDLGFASGGLLGVAVFFVLSGYLITDLLVVALRSKGAGSLRGFWGRRARRLLPALFCMLVVTVAWATLFDRSQLGTLRSDILPAVFYYSNWWYIFHHVSYFAQYGPPSPYGHLWSLAIEEQFYLLWPIVLLVALRFVRSRRALALGALVLAAASAIEMGILYVPYVDPSRIYDGTDTRAFELLIGAALAFVLPRAAHFGPLTRQARTVVESAGAIALLGIFALYWQTSQYDAFVYRGGMALLSLLTAVVIAVCVHPGARFSRVLGVLPLRWIGERSYAMYLWSLPVVVLTTPQGAHRNALRDVLQVAAIVVFSALSWRYVEQPIRHGALGRLIGALREGRRPAAVRGRARWACTCGVVGALVVCTLGLSGAVSGRPGSPEVVANVIPPHHHVPPAADGPGPSPSAGAHEPFGRGPMGHVAPLWPGAGTLGGPGGVPKVPAGEGVTVIGDSIMVDAAPYIAKMLPGAVIDAQIGQQLYQVLTRVAELRREGDIGDRLILELGTNGYFTTQQLETLLDELGPMKRTVLVNTRETRPWEQAVNETIETVARHHPNTTVVDWYAISAHVPQDFYPDGVHLDPAGAQYYASLLVHALELPTPAATGARAASAPAVTTPGPKPPHEAAEASSAEPSRTSSLDGRGAVRDAR